MNTLLLVVVAEVYIGEWYVVLLLLLLVVIAASNYFETKKQTQTTLTYCVSNMFYLASFDRTHLGCTCFLLVA